MLSRQIRILNFDDSVVKQKELLRRFNPAIIDLTRIGPYCRLWSNKKIAAEIKKVLNPEWKHSITFLGSGDFHHISTLLIEQFEEDFCVVIFDLHPDLDNLPPWFSCGSWVNLVAAQRRIKKIVMLGPSSEDLSFPHNMTFNFSWFRDARVEVYPFYHAPSLMLLKNLRENHFIHPRSSGIFQRVTWENLRGKDIRQAITDVIERLPAKHIYISIDKDCLSWDYAATNWERGVINLDWLLEALKILRDNTAIIGVDIAGDYSRIKINSLFKKLCSNWDHPRQLAEELSLHRINEINEATNLRVLDLFSG